MAHVAGLMNVESRLRRAPTQKGLDEKSVTMEEKVWEGGNLRPAFSAAFSDIHDLRKTTQASHTSLYDTQRLGHTIQKRTKEILGSYRLHRDLMT